MMKEAKASICLFCNHGFVASAIIKGVWGVSKNFETDMENMGLIY